MKKTFLFLFAFVLLFQAGKAQNYTLVSFTDAQIKEFVDRHNYYRKEVGSDNLTWSPELAKYALEWAKHQGENGCQMKHRPNKGEFKQSYGENIYWIGMACTPNPTDAVDAWGSEKKWYKGKPIDNTYVKTGHYTQIIWAKTTQVGCAAVKNKKATLVICNYSPAGNYFGETPYKK